MTTRVRRVTNLVRKHQGELQLVVDLGITTPCQGKGRGPTGGNCYESEGGHFCGNGQAELRVFSDLLSEIPEKYLFKKKLQNLCVKIIYMICNLPRLPSLQAYSAMVLVPPGIIFGKKVRCAPHTTFTVNLHISNYKRNSHGAALHLVYSDH